jgi:GntR family transcriptional regulator
VRALARRLKVHHNTVSAAYQDLQGAGHVDLRKGSGVFVRPEGPAAVQEARGLDEMIRLALHAALRKGFTGPEIRAAVERWLAAAPPDRVVVVDPIAEVGELITAELRSAMPVPVSTCAPDDVAREPGRLAGALAVCLPYHVEELKRLVPGVALEPLALQLPDEDRQALLALPVGSIVLAVSHSPTVLPFASVFFKSLRGDELVVEPRLLSARREWRRLLPAADLVLADALSVDAVRSAGARKVREVRILAPAALARLREALTVVSAPPASRRG